jgi:hypothetical protein
MVRVSPLMKNILIIFLLIFFHFTINLFKNPSFSMIIFIKQKSSSAISQRAGMSWLPRQNDFRTFCRSEETEKVYQKLEEIFKLSK